MDDFERLLNSIANPSSCAEMIPEGSLEPIAPQEIEEAYRKDLEQILGKYSLNNSPTE